MTKRDYELRKIKTIDDTLETLLLTYHRMDSEDPTALRSELPSMEKVKSICTELEEIFFPGYRTSKLNGGMKLDVSVAHSLGYIYDVLFDQVIKCLPFRWMGEYVRTQKKQGERLSLSPLDFEGVEYEAEKTIEQLFSKLPDIRELLKKDVRAAYNGDPAAMSYAEIILSYPGLRTIAIYRIAHELYLLNVPLLPRMMTEHAHSETGVDIHPGATIGESFFIDHGTGVVIGETCQIGDRVKIYQGVTLGAKSFPLDEHGNPIKEVKRHPNIEDDVIIYAGATILGGDTTIGKGSVIGGNVWVIESIPPYSKVAQKHSEIEIRTNVPK